MLGDIGHDIKNLLMPVVCGAGLLENEIEKLRAGSSGTRSNSVETSFRLCNEIVSMVRRSTHRLQNHVKQIGDCVKGLSAQPELAPCGISQIVDSVFETLRWLADERGITLRKEGLESLPELMADERRLFNAFYNLVNNAIPEVPSGGSITISGREEASTKGLVMTVADTGRGMPPEIRDSLFTNRTKSRKPGGTGLGTKIVKDVIDAHGGRISVTSEVNRGTTFHLRLPLLPPGTSASP